MDVSLIMLGIAIFLVGAAFGGWVVYGAMASDPPYSLEPSEHGRGEL